jgi:hypothetical protein
MIMPRYPWHAQAPDTRSTPNHEPKQPWIHRKWNLSSLFPSITGKSSHETNRPSTEQAKATSPDSHLLSLPPELRQKILRYTITDEDILSHLLWESVETSPGTWSARVYYFDGREFAWDDETKMFSRAPFDATRNLELIHPLLKEDMEYVKRQWIKRVRSIGEEKRVEVMKRRGDGKNGEYSGFGESRRFPKEDMKKSVLSLMMGTRNSDTS